ncbi:ABC transporter ATP-binding protein [Devosia naphthalenivorans]|uniref:ABC transporter ATP-binding protein n=1 Tax=Devosia naphthalenivorans TaxID=2082392 RepID=UPI000D345254|nr:oligopeptide/dipeptide ABC transporter ATP-binding protein [Devosia naphthalenivorans]
MPDQFNVLLEVRNVRKFFGVRGKSVLPTAKYVQAVNEVNFSVRRGEVFSVVGESGSGKTTLGQMLIRLLDPSDGEIMFDGVDLMTLDDQQMRRARKRMQIIFQDPYSSLNPYMTVGDAIGEVLEVHGITKTTAERDQRVDDLLETVGLRSATSVRYPHEFSGGQRQRIAIARAIAANPEFLVADEPVSALDVSVQAQILNLISDLRASMGLTMVFISHDLAVVRHIADRVAVMYLGRIMEIADVDEFFDRPLHPYSQALLSAVPTPDIRRSKQRQVLSGEIASPMSPPSGCVFRTRCPHAIEACAGVVPPLELKSATRSSACIRDDLLK